MKNLIFLLALIPAICFGQAVTYALDENMHYAGIVIAETTQQYTLHPLPASKPYSQVWGYVSYEPDTLKHPLLIALTGFGENGTIAGANGRTTLSKVMNTGIGKLIKNNTFPVDSFIVLLPQNISSSLKPYYAVTDLVKFVKYAKDNYNVDTTRIYITGLSGGAISLYNFLRAGNKCTAAITCAGSVTTKGVCITTDKTPLWAFHGSADNVVPIGGDKLLYKAYNNCPPNELMKFTIYPDVGHNCWDMTYNNPEIYNWLLSHR